jgi:hypothetical protein
MKTQSPTAMMINWPKTICIIILQIFIISVYSQEKKVNRRIKVTGAVYDIESLDSLPFSDILINRKKHLVTNNKGFFCAALLINDTLVISHLGYSTSEIILSELTTYRDSLHINVLMKKQVYNIEEVSILRYRNYEEFKRTILNHNINNQDLSNADDNIKIMKSQIKNGYLPDKDGRENYSYLMSYKNTCSNSITIFSIPPEKGILPAIKKIVIH